LLWNWHKRSKLDGTFFLSFQLHLCFNFQIKYPHHQFVSSALIPKPKWKIGLHSFAQYGMKLNNLLLRYLAFASFSLESSFSPFPEKIFCLLPLIIECGLKGALNFATVESFIAGGIRVNGSVEGNILSKLSEGATAKQKKKDARGWSPSIPFLFPLFSLSFVCSIHLNPFLSFFFF